MKHWKFWLVVAFSLSIIIVFQNCSGTADKLAASHESSFVPQSTSDHSIDLKPENDK